jgi:alpha-tubulin suppressor-like RCC1 family protein
LAQLSTGRNYTCGITDQQAAYCWGANWFGSLGNGSVTEHSALPMPVTGGHVFVGISSSGIEETQGFTSDGIVYRWGSPGNDIPGPAPVLVTALGFSSMDSGSEPFTFVHGSCGIGAGNAVYCVSSNGVFRGVPAP